MKSIHGAAFAVALLAAGQASRAEESVVSYRSLAPDTALELAKAALNKCRSQGYQVAVAVVDRFGQPQVMLRDRFAGPHTPSTAINKAWTAVSFRTNTRDLIQPAQPGQPLAGLGNLPRVVLLGGGMMIEVRRVAARRRWRIRSARRGRGRKLCQSRPGGHSRQDRVLITLFRNDICEFESSNPLDWRRSSAKWYPSAFRTERSWPQSIRSTLA